MSVQAITWALEQTVGSPTGKIILMILEAAARGVVTYTKLEDVRARVGVSARTFRRAIKRLVSANIVAMSETDGKVQFSFDGLSVTFEGLAGGVPVDDPWQIMRAKVFAAKGSQCHYCGRDASHVDHVIPRSRGGTDDLANLVPSCARCNFEKGPRTPEEWRP